MARGFHLGGAGGVSQNIFDINTIAKADWNAVSKGFVSSYSFDVTPFVSKVVGSHSNYDSSVTYTSTEAYDLSKYHYLFIRGTAKNQGEGEGGASKSYIAIKSATDGTVRTIKDFNAGSFTFDENVALGDLSGDTYYIIICTSAKDATTGTFHLAYALFSASEYELKPYKGDFYLVNANGQLLYTLTHGSEMSHVQNADNLKITESSTSASGTNRHSMFNRVVSDMLGTNKYVRVKYKTASNQFRIGSTSAIGTQGNTGEILPVSASEVATYYMQLDNVLDDIYNNICLQTGNTGAKNIEIYELAIVDDPNS